MSESKNYSLTETAKILGLSVRTVRQWRKDGTLKAKRYDGKKMWFVAQEEIDRLLQSMHGE